MSDQPITKCENCGRKVRGDEWIERVPDTDEEDTLLVCPYCGHEIPVVVLAKGEVT